MSILRTSSLTGALALLGGLVAATPAAGETGPVEDAVSLHGEAPVASRPFERRLEDMTLQDLARLEATAGLRFDGRRGASIVRPADYDRPGGAGDADTGAPLLAAAARTHALMRAQPRSARRAGTPLPGPALAVE